MPQGRSSTPVLRVRMTGETALKLSDYVHNDMTRQCSNPDDCEAAASDEVQVNQEVSAQLGWASAGAPHP